MSEKEKPRQEVSSSSADISRSKRCQNNTALEKAKSSWWDDERRLVVGGREGDTATESATSGGSWEEGAGWSRRERCVARNLSNGQLAHQQLKGKQPRSVYNLGENIECLSDQERNVWKRT